MNTTADRQIIFRLGGMAQSIIKHSVRIHKQRNRAERDELARLYWAMRRQRYMWENKKGGSK